MTQYDLRGFSHPFGIRMKPLSPKSLDATTGNFCSFAAGLGKKDAQPTTETYVNYFESSFQEYLTMCQELASDCDGSEKEAIQLIIHEIVRQSNLMKQQVANSERESTNYLKPLTKENRWGKAILALAEAFEVSAEEVDTTPHPQEKFFN